MSEFTLERAHALQLWLLGHAAGINPDGHTGTGDCYKCQRVYDFVTQTGEFAS